METEEIIWEGRIGSTPLRVGVQHAARIIAEWDTPGGERHKVTNSMEEFERAVLFQLLLGAGETDEAATNDVKAAVAKAQAERPAPKSDPGSQRKRKNPKARQHRRSRTPPRRR